MNLTQNLILKNIEELNRKLDALTQLVTDTRKQATIINQSDKSPAIGHSGDYSEPENSEK